MSMFSDLLYCVNWVKAVLQRDRQLQAGTSLFLLLRLPKNSNVCSAHYIWEKIVEHLVFESMQRILWYVQSYEKLFAQRQLAEFGEKQKKELSENTKIRTEGLQWLIDKAKQVSRLEALTSELVHEFIEKIVISTPEYKGGKRYQKVAIHYNGVGIIREPVMK